MNVNGKRDLIRLLESFHRDDIVSIFVYKIRVNSSTYFGCYFLFPTSSPTDER